MSEYMDSARNCEVLKDGESVDAAEECTALATALRTLQQEHRRLRKIATKLVQACTELSNHIGEV